jgi:murein DD-endopeptidase MepM/ murein hydrolase activator NlpD
LFALGGTAAAEPSGPNSTNPSSPQRWGYVLPVDHGIRHDSGGHGHFLAPRSHGRHNGVDLLAPRGTPVLAACDGMARSGTRGGYGHFVQLVCRVPASLAGDAPTYASLFHAHLDHKSVPRSWSPVRRGDQLGAVGKTGNALSARIMPHLHLELIIRGSEEAAKHERHFGLSPHGTPAADRFVTSLNERCLRPRKLGSRLSVRRERRADPFLVLTCLDAVKPPYRTPDGKLASASERWSKHYHASRDLDRDTKQ